MKEEKEKSKIRSYSYLLFLLLHTPFSHTQIHTHFFHTHASSVVLSHTHTNTNPRLISHECKRIHSHARTHTTTPSCGMHLPFRTHVPSPSLDSFSLFFFVVPYANEFCPILPASPLPSSFFLYLLSFPSPSRILFQLNIFVV